MIDFNKTIKRYVKTISPPIITKQRGRINIIKKVTKENLNFLRSLGFEI